MSIYRGCIIYRIIDYSRYIGGGSIYSQFTEGNMLHVGYMSSRSCEIGQKRVSESGEGGRDVYSEGARGSVRLFEGEQ